MVNLTVCRTKFLRYTTHSREADRWLAVGPHQQNTVGISKTVSRVSTNTMLIANVKKIASVIAMKSAKHILASQVKVEVKVKAKPSETHQCNLTKLGH